MRKKLLQASLLVSAAVVLLCAASLAQVTQYQENEWLNSPAATSHIGNIEGHAADAAMPYRRYCTRLSR